MLYPLNIIPKQINNIFEITVPDLPGCKFKTENIDLGVIEIKKIICDHLSMLAEYGETIPKAKGIMYWQNKNPIGIWALVEIDITPYLGKSHKINVTLPELLIKQIDDKVSKSEEYKTRSGFIAKACLSELSH